MSLLISLAGATPPPAEVTKAKALYQGALKKFDVGRFEEAAADFEEVYGIMADPALLFNIAQAYGQAKKPDKAVLFYRSYLANFSRRGLTPPNAAAVEQRIEEQSRLVEEQKKAAAEQAATAKPAEKPPEPSPVSPPTEAPARSPVSAPRAKPNRLLVPVGAALLGVGVVGIAAGSALLAIAARDANTVESAATKGGEFTSSLKSIDRQGQSFDKAGIALVAVGVVLAVAGIVPVALGAKRRASDRAVRILPFADGRALGMICGGRF